MFDRAPKAIGATKDPTGQPGATYEVDTPGTSIPQVVSKLGSLKNWTVAELLEARSQIDAHLPAMALNDINIEEHLLLQLTSLQSLQATVLNDDSLPLNQRAQLANSVTTLLTKLTELQGQVYTQERIKALENLLLRHARKLPVETVEAFLADYEQELERLQG